MYNEQYAKGIVHLIVFVILVSLTSDMNGIFGLFVAGWVCYMAIEAHHTARAKRDGTPLPNPFGLNDIGERFGFGRAWPTGGPQPPTPGSYPGYPEAGAPGPSRRTAARLCRLRRIGALRRMRMVCHLSSRYRQCFPIRRFRRIAACRVERSG